MKKYKILSILLICTAIGCRSQKKEPTLANDVVLQLKLDQSQLQTLQAQANPIIKDINDIQEKAKKDYPGYQVDLNTQKLVPSGDKK